MRKEEKITYSLIAAILGVVFLLAYLIVPSPKQVSFSPIEVNLNGSCSLDSIKNLWESVFLENSEGITIFLGENRSCIGSVAYKIKNNTEIFLISVLKKDGISGIVSANHGIANESHIQNITPNIPELREITLEKYFQPQVFSLRELTLNYFKLENESKKMFKETNLSINNTLEEVIAQEFGMIITEKAYLSSKAKVSIIIFTNSSLERERIYFEQTNTTCTQNWTEQSRGCTNETQIISYSDSNNCNNLTGIPSNKTIKCDSDNNGIIGNIANITKRNINDLKIKINDSELNLSKNYTGELEVEIFDNSTKLIDFDWEFVEALDLTEIVLEKSNSTVPSLIINGLNVTKRVYLTKANHSTFCIKDSIISNISEISNNCSSSGETPVTCPGTNSRFACTLINSNTTYAITGLRHSGIKGIILQQISCTSSWNCTNWTSCTNNIKTRVCLDANSCGTLVGKPNETQTCTVTPTCTSSWNCTNWTECTSEGTQARTCSDSNRCTTPTSSPPPTNSTCTYKTTTTNVIVIIIVILIILIITVGVIIFLLMNKKEETNFYAPKPTYYH